MKSDIKVEDSGEMKDKGRKRLEKVKIYIYIFFKKRVNVKKKLQENWKEK